MAEKQLTPRQAAEYLSERLGYSMSERTVRRALEAGRIGGSKPLGRWHTPTSALEHFIETKGNNGTSG